jgi:hypothetical protein
MLKRYHIIDVHDLRRAAQRAGAYAGTPGRVELLRGWPACENTDAAENADRTPAVEPITARG